MVIANLGQIPVAFDVLRQNYPTYTRLPAHISRYMDALNAGNPPGAPRNTPCCFQISEALNLAGAEHKVPARSYRRPCARLGSNYYLGAVDELENHLTSRYGRGQNVHECLGPNRRPTAAQMQLYLSGRTGILTFRDNGYGFHTELWDGSSILQNGAPAANGAAISAAHIWSQPRIIFWETVGDDNRDPLPDWIVGWWQVSSTATPYYYYISDQYVVFYSPLAPLGVLSVPTSRRLQEGRVTLAEGGFGFTIIWEPSPDGTLSETYVARPGDPTRIEGLIDGQLPATATKMRLPDPAPRPSPHSHH